MSNVSRNAPPGSTPRPPSFIERNAADGVELDTDTGAPLGVYFKGALNLLQEQETKYYQGLYGEDKVRRADTGDLIFRTTDPDTGKPKDIVANPKGMGVADFIGLATQAPVLAATAFAAVKGKVAPGIWNAIKVLGRSAGTGAATGVSQDILTQASQDRPVDFEGIAKSRGEGALYDIVLGGAAGVVGKVYSKARSPFAAQGIRADVLAANEILAAETGVKLPMTVAQITGNPILGRAETFLLKLPGSSTRLEARQAEFNDAVKRVQNSLMGVPDDAAAAAVLPSTEQVGKDVAGALGAKGVAAAGTEEAARKQVLATGTQEAQDVLAARVGTSVPVDRVALGDSLAKKAVAERDAFQAQAAANYSVVTGNPKAQAFQVEPKGLAADARDTLDNLASQEVTRTRTGPLPGTIVQGPITTTGTELLPEFIPPGLISRLHTLAGMDKAKVRLTDLMAMRTDVRNSIAQGNAIPDFNTGQLKHLEGQLTTSIKDGLAQLNDPALTAAWEKANTAYATGAKRFEKRGITALFRAPGHELTPEEIVNRAVKGESAGGVFRDYREFFGAKSPEFQEVRRAVVDHVFDRPLDPRRVSMQGRELITKLQELRRNAPDVAKDVFGSDLDTVMEIGEALGVAQRTIKLEDLSALVARGGTLTETSLQTMLRAGEAKARLYSNNLIKQATDGTLDVAKLNPSEFVDEFVFRAKPDDVRGVVLELHNDPAVLEAVRQKTVQRLLDKSAAWDSRAESVAAMVRGETAPFNPKVLAQELGAPGSPESERLRALLGGRTYGLLQTLSVAAEPAAMQTQAASSAAGLASGSLISRMLSGELKFVESAAGNLVASIVYTHPLLERWARSVTWTPDRSAMLVATMIGSAPFAKALTVALMDENASEAKAVLVGTRLNEALAGSAARQAQSQPGSTQGPNRLMTPQDATGLLGPRPADTPPPPSLTPDPNAPPGARRFLYTPP